MWRVGHISAPLDFVPHDFVSWAHRYDDPDGSYRTLYCAPERETCFLEVFYDKRPDLATIDDIVSTQGCSREEAWRQAEAGMISRKEILDKAIAPARIEVDSGEMVDIEDLALRFQLELEHSKELDLSVLRSKDRFLTQKLGRFLHERGVAGVAYGSRIVNSRCIALFEGRARLVPDGPAQPLEEVLDELAVSLGKIGLSLKL